MAWTAIYEDLSEYASKETSPSDLPLDGLQAVIVDGKPFCGFDVLVCRKRRKKWQLAISRAPVESFRRTRNTTLVRCKTTSTRQFHKIEKHIGLWSPLNKEPHEGWMKDVIGWKLWTAKEAFTSEGIDERKWLAHWKSLPSHEIQGLVLYENWKTGKGQDYRQYFGGHDHYVMAPSKYGPIFLNSDDPIPEIEARYPGASVKIGKQLPDEDYWPIHEAMMAAGTFR